MKNWFKKAWLKLKKWGIAILAALGIIVGGGLYAETVNFTYTRADQRMDGTPLALSDIAETRLYCDGSLVTTEPGADENIDADLGLGSHSCHATHVDTAGQESDPSNIVVRMVLPARPNAPVLDDLIPGSL